MKKYLTVLTILGLSLSILAFTGCGKDDVDDTPNTPPKAEDNKANNETSMTKAEYGNYISERYDYYFDNETIDKEYDVYDIYDDEFNYNGTYNEFIVGYNDFYAKDRTNLEAFKKDIEANYRKGDPEVDKYHNEIITSIDKAIIASDEYNTSFSEKTKDYGTLAKDEVVKGLRTLGRVPHEARMELDKLVDDAKDRMGID
ncbi:MAG: hypothetical protein RR844_07250 [Clostridium sp.]